jgi:hypothetical protein
MSRWSGVVGHPPRIYTDEQVHTRLAAALRKRGYEAESCQEAGRDNRDIDDGPQLEYAVRREAAILSNNIGDFQRLEQEWKDAGREHYDIILYARITNLGELLRRVELHLKTCDAQRQYNTLLWLPR